MNKKYSLLILLALLLPLGLQAQKPPQDMDRFLDNLLKRMTLEEKIGQLNLPVTGEITTGQAKSSDIATKIKRGEVGGLFNLKGVDKIRDVQRLAVENSRLGIPLLFGMDVITDTRPFSLSPWDFRVHGTFRLSKNRHASPPLKPVPTASRGLSVRW